MMGAKKDSENPVLLGRPSIYTDEIAELICKGLAEGKTLRAVCEDESLPHESTVRNWAVNLKNDFFTRYAKARTIGLDARADYTCELAAKPLIGTKTKVVTDASGKVISTEVITGDAVDRTRLIVDTNKWYLCKLAPKRYGDRVIVDSDDTKVDDGMKELAAAIRNSPVDTVQ